MPTIKELTSIVDLRKISPASDTTAFPDILSHYPTLSFYWSATTNAFNTSNACTVHFDYGNGSTGYKSYSYHARAVRGGQRCSLGHLVISAPAQASNWEPGTLMPIAWDTQDISGNVKISVSREGSKDGTFETIADSTLNDGNYDWTVVGYMSFNCVLKIEPLNEPDKWAAQGLFSIYYDTELSGTVTDLSTGNPLQDVVVSTDNQNSITNGQGFYSFMQILSSGVHNITFSKSGYQTVTISDVEIKTGEPTELNVSLPISLSGIVTDLSTEHPLSEVIVSTIDDQNTQTNSQGYYALGSLTPGAYDITFSKNDYQTVTISGVVIIAGQGTELNIELIPTGLLNIFTTDLPVSESTIEYNSRVRISGGVYPYTHSIAYGALPPGLSLDSAYGNITGIPTTPGSYTFSVGVTDALNAYAEREFTIDVTEKLEIITQSPLSRGTRGANYFFSIEATGGTLPHAFAKISGSLPSGISISSSGNLSGTPSSTESYDFTIRVTDASNRTAEKTFHFEIVDPLIISTLKLNNGIAGDPYNQTLFSSGGYCANHWAVYSGILPAGLSLDTETGALSGTPTEATYDTVVFFVSDEDGRIMDKDLTLQVADPLQILTTSLPDGLRDEPYSETISLAGGIGPFNFSYAGQLPDGLSLNSSTGIISGTPATTGFTNVSITVSDSTYPYSQSVTQNLSIRTTSLLTILTSAVLPKGKKGVEINTVILQAGGGPLPYQWCITSGYLPSGITLNTETGQLSGTPSDKGDFLFTIKVTDADNNTAEKEFFCLISDTLSITTSEIPAAAKDEVYNFTLEAKGGLLPYQWQIKIGTLPTGLLFNTTTGTIYGRPTTRQTYSFTVEMSDNDSPAQTAEHTYIIEVDVIAGDIDGSGSVDMRDMILTLQAVSGIEPTVTIHRGDVNGDGRIGMEEAIYILQVVCGLKIP